MIDRRVIARVRRWRLRTRRSASADLLGPYLTRIKGEGLEYVESRAYEPGDDSRRLDWKVTARTGEVHTKLFREERVLRVGIAIDVSASMDFGGPTRTKLDTALTAGAALALAAVQSGGMAELWLFDREVRMRLGPLRTVGQAWRAAGALDTWLRQVVPAPATDFAAWTDAMLRRRRRPQLVFVLSDFASGAPDAAIRRLAGARIDVVPFWTRARMEAEPRHLRLRMRAAEGSGRVGVTIASEIAVAGRRPFVLWDDGDVVESLRRAVAAV